MSTIRFETNTTIEQIENEDFFADVFSDERMVFSMVVIYFVGLVGVVGIVFIIWLERSGQAGPFRTLINQLVSFNYEAFLLYWIGNTIDTLRAAIGPLPQTLCKIGVYAKNWAFYNICFFTLVLTLTKFAFLCIFKSIPEMNDNFLAFYFYVSINLITFMIMVIWMALPGKDPLAVLICTGNYYEEWLTESKKVPTVVYVLLLCTLFGLAASISIWITKYKNKRRQLHPRLKQREHAVDLGSSLYRSGFIMILLTTAIWTLYKYESLHPESLKDYPNYLWLYSFQIFYPVTLLWSMLFAHCRNRQFRKAIQRVWNHRKVSEL